ncbi:hypothetical protein SCKG_3801 [Saccharomyces cerevisiae]|nr:hypothetical protein SCKG_3801 [Saccharomyces cerevisiae]
MSLISALQTTDVESVQTSPEQITERKAVRVSTLQESLHSSEMHRAAPETPRSISNSVHKLKTIYSTYQQSGQPLSKEAIFRAKQKYGILNTPANYKTLGLGDSKSESVDLAARLASKRTKVSPDDCVETAIEQKARGEAFKVTFSKIPLTPPEDVPITVNLGLKGRRDFLTRLAAQKALAFSPSLDNSMKGTSDSSSVKKKRFSGAPIGNEFDENLVNPQHPAGFKSVDLSKVLDGAERRAISRVNDRLYPQKVNFKNGLQSSDQSGVSKANKEVFKEGTLEKLEHSAEQFLESHAGNERQRLSDEQYMYAKSAADAVKDLDPKTLEDPDFAAREAQKKLYIKQVASPVVLNEAQKLANRKLQDIDSRDTYMLLFGNQAYNKLAVDIALQHYSVKQEEKKKIYLGGGLWMTPEEVNAVAKKLISPVVNEIDERASRQRDVDKDIERRSRVLDQEYEDWNFMERAKEQNDGQLLLAMASKQQQEKEAKKAEEGQRYDQFVQKMNIKLQQKERELENARENRENLRNELQERLSKNLSGENDELNDWNDACERDLKNSSIEHYYAVRSHFDNLGNSERGYDELLEERSKIQVEIERLVASIAEHKTAIHGFRETADAGRAIPAVQKQKIPTRKDLLDATVNDPLVISAEMAKEEAEMATEECMLKELQVDEMIIIRNIMLRECEKKLEEEKETAKRSRRGTGGSKNNSNFSRDVIMNTPDNNEKVTPIGKSASPKDVVKSRFLSTYNTGKDIDSSASARSITGVSGVLDDGPKTPTSNKENELIDDEVKSYKVHQAVDATGEDSIANKRDKSSRPAANSGGSITIEQFLFNKNADKQGLSKTESVTMKREPVVDQMDSKKGHDFTHCNDNGRRSFSGFSQGSIENDYSNEVTDDQDDQEGSEIRVRDSNDSNTSPKESFFKEVI